MSIIIVCVLITLITGWSAGWKACLEGSKEENKAVVDALMQLEADTLILGSKCQERGVWDINDQK